MFASAVTISRTFTVAAQPDRSYYLPGQNASVAISAKYLFGKELTHGAVKLVREEQGHWDSAQHKWVADEADGQSAELDHSGRATFTLDFTKLHGELAEQTYRRFMDLNYAAYVTDPSTGKTEQRRFQVRLSHQPIHVYVSGMNLSGDRAPFMSPPIIPTARRRSAMSMSAKTGTTTETTTKSSHPASGIFFTPSRPTGSAWPKSPAYNC
jgi:hypothetical protein